MFAFLGSVSVGILSGILLAGNVRPALLPFRLLFRVVSTTLRGVPALILILFGYYGPQFLGIRIDSFFASAVVMAAIGGAAVGEVVRAALNSVEVGQRMAADSLGMSRLEALRHVIGPQAIRVAIPPFVSIAAGLLRLTAITGYIGYFDVMQAGQTVAFRTAQPFVAYLSVASIYLVFSAPIVVLGRYFERRRTVTA